MFLSNISNEISRNNSSSSPIFEREIINISEHNLDELVIPFDLLNNNNNY